MRRRRRNTEMKFRVFSSILLGFLLVMTVQGDYSSASAVSGQEERNKNKHEEPFERNGAALMRKLGLGRKKFIIHEETSTVDSKNEKEADGEGTSKISGATYFDGICDFEREGDKIVKCKGEKSIKQRKLKMSGFVAFTEDYHGPRHHLPKHN